MSNILALDLGTCTGYAITRGGSVIASTEEWATPKEVKKWKRSRLTRRGDPRVIRFYEWLKSQISGYGITHVVFEDVEFCSQTYQCQLWTSFRTCVWVAVHCFPHATVEAVPVGTLKKFATGSGNADKMGMAKALARRFPKRFELHRLRGMIKDLKTGETLDDNAVDAFWLHCWAKENCL